MSSKNDSPKYSEEEAFPIKSLILKWNKFLKYLKIKQLGNKNVFETLAQFKIVTQQHTLLNSVIVFDNQKLFRRLQLTNHLSVSLSIILNIIFLFVKNHPKRLEFSSLYYFWIFQGQSIITNPINIYFCIFFLWNTLWLLKLNLFLLATT